MTKRLFFTLASGRLVFLTVVRCSLAAKVGKEHVKVNKPIDKANSSCLKSVPLALSENAAKCNKNKKSRKIKDLRDKFDNPDKLRVYP